MKRKLITAAVLMLAVVIMNACAAQQSGAGQPGSGGEVADQMYFEDAKNVDLILFCCDGKYMSLETGSSRWLRVYADVPDTLALLDGEFASVKADIVRVTGGVAGYMGNPDIKKVNSVQPLTLGELVNNGVLQEYDPAGGSFYGVCSLSSDDGLYCIAGMDGKYHVYNEKAPVGAYDTTFEAEIAMGLRSKADSSLDYERVPGQTVYIFRCQDKYLAYCNSVLMNNNGLWKPILNGDFENQPEGIALNDGEAVCIKNADIYKVNGGDYVDAPLLSASEDYEKCSYNEITMRTSPVHWEEGSDGAEGEIRQYRSGEYLIFFHNGGYRVYRDDFEQQLLVGAYDTAAAVNAALGLTDTAAAGPTEVDVTAAGSAQAFSKVLFAKGMEMTNPVESPVSAYLAMSLAGQGAKGDTAAEFDAVMGKDRQTMAKQLMEQLPADTEDTKVALANSAWLDDRLNCEADWLAAAKDGYHADIYQKRLSTVGTMGDINSWVKENTQGLIPELMQEPLDDMTRLVLINTIYFKGKWQSAFDGDNTRKEIFKLADGTEAEADMMRKTGNMYYLEGKAGETGVVLPYRDSELLFVALKPAAGQTVRQMYGNLDLTDLGHRVDQVKNGEMTRVNLWLPKFRVTFDRILNQDLAEMGIRKAFDTENADFTGISKTDELFISLVRQKAVFIVDEEGTEAAAVTEITLRTNSMAMEEKPKQVHFDEPFLYMIFDPETDMPLFVGIMDDPTQAQDK